MTAGGIDVTSTSRDLSWADFFGAFALVTVEHVSVDIRFPLDSSDLFIVMTDGSLLLCLGARSE